MAKYRAKMQHSKDTIYKLVQTQYDTFQFHKKLIHTLIAFGLILFGLYADQSMFMPLIALFVGCVMLANLNAYPKAQAKEVLKMMGDNYPQSDYYFGGGSFTFNKEAEPVPYRKIIRLVEDREYLYLYVSKQSAYMVDKRTISRGEDLDLKEFLAIETGLKWTRPASLLRFNLKDLFPKTKDDYRGPRLK